MGNLIYVYGDSQELEAALELLSDAGLADKGRVIEGRHGDASNGREDRTARERYEDRDGIADGSLAGEGIVPPAAALGSHVPLGTTGGAMNPYAVAAVAGDADDYASSRTRTDLDDLVAGNSEEAEHYADVLRGGGSLLVIEARGEELDRVEQLLASHQGQGFARR